MSKTKGRSSHPVQELKSQLQDLIIGPSESLDKVSHFKLDRPPKFEFGDYSTNAALLQASSVDSQPRDVADQMAKKISNSKELGAALKKVEVAGPGFLNLFLSDSWYGESLAKLLGQGNSFGGSVADRPESINIEFVSANPTGPLHIGHGRHAAFGDSLARILEFAGNQVTREFYINDFGGQIARFADSVAARMEKRSVPEDGYQGRYIEELAGQLADIGVDTSDSKAVAEAAIPIMLAEIRQTLTEFGVEFDSYSSEASLHSEGKVEEILKLLDQQGESYEKDGALWLKTTDFGDDKDRVLRRSDGDLTYFAADIAYHQAKAAMGFDRLIDIWGADHHGYVGRIKAAFEATGHDPDRIELLIMQLVQLLEGGERAQMSKRKGEFVTLAELVSDIGRDAARWFLLSRSHDTAIDLDLDLARKAGQDNPVYYCQYAHARIASILRKADLEDGAEADLMAEFSSSELKPALHESEKALIRKLLDFPDEVREAATKRAPHRFTTYCLEVGSDFSAFYRDCKVVGAGSKELERFRLGLCLATKSVISKTLSLLGVEAPEQM